MNTKVVSIQKMRLNEIFIEKVSLIASIISELLDVVSVINMTLLESNSTLKACSLGIDFQTDQRTRSSNDDGSNFDIM